MAESLPAILANMCEPVTGASWSTLPWAGYDAKAHRVTIAWPFAAQSQWDAVEKAFQAALPGIQVEQYLKVKARDAQSGQSLVPGIKNILGIASGKGGVGKSTVTAHLARALQQEGATVGVLDADIYGPSQPRMLGAPAGHPEALEGKKMRPVDCAGIATMSVGYLLENEETATIWRGPMVSGALVQMLQETQWGELDYLLIDLPPGTGDIQLTLAQKIPVTGAVVVTTPQDIALLDARKAYQFFKKTGISVLGIIENMSVHQCTQCGHEEAIFGQGGGARMARQYGLDLLGELPLAIEYREGMDQGQAHIARFIPIAQRIGAKLAEKRENFSAKFGKIVTT